MKIAIIGTRGIPNRYGGFEQFAEYLSVGLVEKGHSVTVFNSSEHPFKKNEFKEVKIIQKYCPESKIGSAAHFLYDFLSIKHATKQNFDIIYNLGYQSSAPSILCLKKNKTKTIWVTNMDGLEWKRDKWNTIVKWITKKMEAIAVKDSDHLVSDNEGIKEYYRNVFNINSSFIAYGASIPINVQEQELGQYKLTKHNYFILVARLEPENSIEKILDGYVESKSKTAFIVIGNYKTKYGKFLRNKYSHHKRIKFIGAVYDFNSLNSLRKFSKLYFHGHTVGGTNPSLLEAMGLGCNIIAHNNEFNKSVLKQNGVYFNNSNNIKNHIKDAGIIQKCNPNGCINEIRENYNWELIINQHENLFKSLIGSK